MISSLPKGFCLLPLLSAGLVLSGCGGGGTRPNPGTNGQSVVENSLSRSDFYDSQQNRYYDIYVCDAPYSGTATAEMFSNDLDSYLLVYRKTSGNNFDLIAQNDDANAAGDARLDFDVQRGKQYRIIATSSAAQEGGDYELRLSRELGRPALDLSNARTSQSQGVKLPPIPVKEKLKPKS